MPYIIISVIYLILSWFIIQHFFFKKNKKRIFYPLLTTSLWIVGSVLFVFFIDLTFKCNEGCVLLLMAVPIVAIINFVCTFFLASLVYEYEYKEVKFGKIFWIVFLIASISIAYYLIENYLANNPEIIYKYLI